MKHVFILILLSPLLGVLVGNTFEHSQPLPPTQPAVFCTHPDYAALMELYNATAGAAWTENDGWTAGAAGTNCDPCSWYGVDCNTEQRVTGLTLLSVNMSGTLPDLNLPFLDSLEISFNDLSGNLPAFSNTPELVYLSCGYNQFTGSMPLFTNSPNVTSVQLSNNQLTGQIPAYTNLPNLRRVVCWNNNLDGPLPDYTGFPNFDQLRCSGNDLSGCYYAYMCDLFFFDATGNTKLAWEGDITNFCAGTDQIGAPCDDGDTGTTGEVIQSDCSCGLAPAQTCTHPDYAALMEFYNSTNGANWTDNTGWADGAAGTNCDPCSWSGVGCDANDRVITISLVENNLVGTLPDLDLPFLERINIKQNTFTGAIPDFSNTPDLAFFIAYNNAFNAPIPDFGKIPKLQEFRVNNNDLTGTIPDFTNLPDLAIFHCDGNELEGTIPDFTNLPNLTSFQCDRNNLEGEIPDFSNLPLLDDFACERNELSGPIPAFAGLPLLATFDCADNNLSGCFPDVVCGLTSFDATGNPLLPWEGDHTLFCGGTEQIGAPCNDGDGATTGETILANCSCGIAAVEQEPIAALTADPTTGPDPLEVTFDATGSSDPDGTIEQYNFDFGDGNSDTNTTGLANHTYTVPGTYTASVVVMDNDGLTDKFEITITVEIGDCTHPDYAALMQLYNSTNGASWMNNTGWAEGAAGTNCDPCSWFGVGCNADDRVTTLSLADNNLDGTIPDFTVPFLERLQVKNNRLSGIIPDFATLPNLTFLIAYNNDLSGNIPDFSSIPLLQEFRVNNNELAGPIPDFTSVPDLIYLYIDGNNLTGNIPDFSNLPNLQEFHCDRNNLDGSIPDFSNLWTLVDFACERNNLSGNIPDFINLPNLESFDCADNNLSCLFPDFVCNLVSFDATGNPLLPWEGDHTNFCNGEDQIGATCNDGDATTTDEVIHGDCSCQSYEAVCSLIVPTVTPSPASCDQPTGSATVAVNGGTGKAVFQWSAGASNGNQVANLAPGNYSVTVTDGACEIVETFTIASTNEAVEGAFVATICPEEQVVINGQQFDQNTPSGTVVIPNGAVSGCDSLVRVQLTFFEPAQAVLDTTLCEGESLIIAGTTYSEAVNNLVIDLPERSVNNCDSSILFTLRYRPALSATATTVADSCNLQSGSAIVNPINAVGTPTYQWSDEVGAGNSAVNLAAGNYSVTITDDHCTFVLPITIASVQANPPGTYTDLLCPEEQVTINGQTFDRNNPTGTVVIPGGAVNGCDSTVNVNLSFHPEVVTPLNVTLCEGESVTVNGTTFNDPVSNLRITIPNATEQGCDSTILLSIQIQEAPTVTIVSTADSCQQQSGSARAEVAGGTGNPTFQWSAGTANTNTVTNLAAGDYSVTITDGVCERTQTFTIPAANETVEGSFSAVLCQGEQVEIDGQIFDENNPTGTVLLPGGASSGCDSLVNVDLSFTEPLNVTIETEPSYCGQPTGKGTVVLANGSTTGLFRWSTGAETTINEATDLLAGEYFVTLTNNGCEQVESFTIALVEQLIPINYAPAPLCREETVTMGNQTFSIDNPSGTVQLPSSTGCDSLVSVQLTFREAVQGALDTTLCAGQSLTIGQVEYTEAVADLLIELPGAATEGCDSSLVLNLQFREAFTIQQSDTICARDSYDFYGRTLTESGVYEEVISNGNEACDSLIQLTLTVLEPPITEIEQTICTGASFEFCGESLREPGLYSCALVSVNDCDSTVNLQLWVDEAPTVAAMPDQFSMKGTQEPLELNVLANDTLDGPIQWTLFQAPQNGTVEASADSTVLFYQPEPLTFGLDSFYYQVCLTDCPEVCDTAVVYMDVQGGCLEDLDAPTAFSPNNDGLNDLFDPLELLGPDCDVVRDEVELTIINRLGEVIYSVPSYQPWNGRTASEGDVPEGTYFYLLRYREIELRKPIMVVR